MNFKSIITLIVIFTILLVNLLPVLAQQTATDWVNYGNQVYSQGKYGDAIKYYDAAINLEGNNITAWLMKGNALYALGKFQEAVKCYDKVLSVDQNNKNAKDYKNMALQQAGSSPVKPAPEPQGMDYTIDGSRMGPFQLGRVSMEQVKDALGAPSKIEDNKNAASVICYYSNLGMIFYFGGGQVLSNIITTNPKFQTSKGIRVGSRADDAKKIYEGTEVLLSNTTQYDYIKNVISDPCGLYLSYAGMRFIFSPSYTIVGIEIGG